LLRGEGVEQAESVLDVGCGDLQVLGTLELKNYVGIDRSLESLAIAARVRPGFTFTRALRLMYLDALRQDSFAVPSEDQCQFHWKTRADEHK
jgi:hypothetical protein